MRTSTLPLAVLLIFVLASASVCAAPEAARTLDRPRRPVHTYSIVARDAETGELGVAVQSHWFSVGTGVTWAEAGVGAVATQSFTEISYGPLGLELMKAGKTAPQALAALVSVDPNADVRQVAMVDRHGNVAVHTGAKCIVAAGDYKGDGFTTQANLMEKDTVWGAMAAAFEQAKGDLAERLTVALEAGEREGGDIRGRQSAAILVVPGTSEGSPWRERTVDLRVDDHSEPLVELRRLLNVHRTYERMDQGDAFFAEGDVEGALAEYAAAATMSPENVEVRYWQAITMIGAGRVGEALPILAEVFREQPRWRTLTPRLPASGLLPEDPELMERILRAGE
ncbi:MAG: DUF1028 domain-containing protein [Thermoanaerobaculia bacterium]